MKSERDSHGTSIPPHRVDELLKKYRLGLASTSRFTRNLVGRCDLRVAGNWSITTEQIQPRFN